MISFHFEVSLKMADLFSSHGCIMYVLFCEISEFRQALHAFVLQPQPCSAMRQLRDAESHAGLWKRQRHKSHLVSFKTSYWFATNYWMVIKKVLTCLLNGWLAPCFYLAICSGLCPFKLVRSITSFKLLP